MEKTDSARLAALEKRVKRQARQIDTLNGAVDLLIMVLEGQVAGSQPGPAAADVRYPLNRNAYQRGRQIVRKAVLKSAAKPRAAEP